MTREVRVHLLNPKTRTIFCGVKVVIEGASCYKNFVFAHQAQYVTCKRCLGSKGWATSTRSAGG